ncbi:hypothetical protein BABINDRAFT_160701 [Babjeviella inositovora NRRL Y-12698]|uniref:Uncharacterized protein n=1 Tax=Babjeviella inositovora NRRL Y-12698 TaxID=984486 RepID=A0A1E3QW72_9ASCO|nr:uncharacterized protein BABINDRAFT_160701 [Babjeviella inositovora NRRL Y-12698]ODQ81342.1 hypothetical protein BABINDRAFT_160701 [Babjeviella inositovora NRRL Y-12698]
MTSLVQAFEPCRKQPQTFRMHDSTSNEFNKRRFQAVCALPRYPELPLRLKSRS